MSQHDCWLEREYLDNTPRRGGILRDILLHVIKRVEAQTKGED